MTKQEASIQYGVPVEVLEEYERWGLCGPVRKVFGDWQYDDTDVELLSMIMTLRDIGFEKDEIARYMELILKGEATYNERQKILEKKRSLALDELHFQQKCIDRLDYLRYEIQKAKQCCKNQCDKK